MSTWQVHEEAGKLGCLSHISQDQERRVGRLHTRTDLCMAVLQCLWISPQAHMLESIYCGRRHVSDSVNGSKASITQMCLYADIVRAHLKCFGRKSCVFPLDNIPQKSTHTFHLRIRLCSRYSGPPPHLQGYLSGSMGSDHDCRSRQRTSMGTVTIRLHRHQTESLTHHQDPEHVLLRHFRPLCPRRSVKHVSR